MGNGKFIIDSNLHSYSKKKKKDLRIKVKKEGHKKVKIEFYKKIFIENPK